MIEKLAAGTPPSLARIGGKACGLVRLMAAGFDVPDVWCLPADRPGDASALEEAVAAFANQHPDTLFAVRSSATAEDLEDASFAGVYTTLLGVRGPVELRSAVATCCASLDSQAAHDYRTERGIDDPPQMAVLFQRLIAADVAGVLLTTNPMRAFAQEWVVDAAFGLGEGVVSGRTDPDHLVVDRHTGEVREERLGEKKIALRHGHGGVLIEETVPEALRRAPCLDGVRREALADVVRRVGQTLGPRMDIEWAFEGERLHLLQARPITGLPPERPREVWSRKFGDEYMADYTTPSGYAFLVRWIREYSFTATARELGQTQLLEMEPLRRHHGYVYLSGRYTAVSSRALPLAARSGALRGWFPPLWNEVLRAEPFQPRLLFRSLVRPFRDPRGPMKKNLAALEAHAERIVRDVIPELSRDYTRYTDAQLGQLLGEVDELGLDHFRVIRWGMGTYAPLLHSALEGLMASWTGDRDGALYQDLVSGLPGTRTAEINLAVWKLAWLARNEPALAADIRSRVSLPALRKAHPGAAFLTALDGFLAAHGHRATTRDIAEPRWSETPELILALVRPQLVGEEAPASPEVLEAASAQRRERAEAQVLTRLGRGPGATLRRRVLAWVWERTRSFTVYRENQRYYLDAVLCHLRNIVLEYGRRLEAKGVLETAWDAFLLTDLELRKRFAAPARDPEFLAVLRERRAHYEKWKGRLAATFLFDDIETEGEIAEGDPSLDPAAQTESDGLGASRGLARGPLRVIRSVEEVDQIQPGEILVAENIDPGWTSVFPLLAGLVTETGGQLSHGALLAREYGIPAVMGVRAATQRFETGVWASIDGSTGRVEVEPSETSGAT